MITDFRINSKGELEGKVIPLTKWEEIYTKDQVVAMLEKIKERLDEEKGDYISKEELDIAYGIDRSLVYIESEIYALRGNEDGN